MSTISGNPATKSYKIDQIYKGRLKCIANLARITNMEDDMESSVQYIKALYLLTGHQQNREREEEETKQTTVTTTYVPYNEAFSCLYSAT